MSTPLDEFTTEELAALRECLGSGNVEEELMQNAGTGALRQLAPSLAPWRFKAVLYGRWEVFGQDMEACGVEAGEAHEPEEDVFRVTTRNEKRVRKWYKIPSGGGTPVVVMTLEWEQTISVSPSTPQTRRLAGGGYKPAITCEETTEGEKPEKWDEGPDAESGFFFVSEDVLPIEKEDADIITGESSATAGMGAEVSLAVSDWAVRKTFGRLWASGNTTAFGDFTGASAPTKGAGSVRRVVYELQLVGWRISSTLKWTETRSKPGEDTVESEEEQPIDASTAWQADLEFDYPEYGWTVVISNLRIVPV